MKEREQVLEELLELLEQVDLVRSHLTDLIDQVTVATFQVDELDFDDN